VGRGLEAALAEKVAEQLMSHDALGAHARDELGIIPEIQARPVQAAFASAGSFSVGAALPLLLVFITPLDVLIPVIIASSLFFLALLGALAARTGGAGVWKGALRVTFWGALAMGLTAGIGVVSGTVLK
jgi:VIT1/CCC1 family predicted Fe2+/Mn2+ transporter